MNIGIITFQRADNYGAMLQCYALQEYIKKLGHKVEVIDYRNSNLESDHEVRFNVNLWFSFLFAGRILAFVKYIPHLFRRQYRRKLFAQFRNEFLNLSDSVSGNDIPIKYDRIIIGSDQMWTIGCYKKYDPVYWGQFQHDAKCKIFGYAISSKADFMMHLSIDDIRKITDSFEGLSFREKKIADIIACITGKQYPVTIDPTLLFDQELWDPLIDKKWESKKFVAIYYVRGKTESIISDAHKYAQDNNCTVIDLSSKSYSISDFVSAIKYSQAVFTSSFHATVFSVIFNKPFNTYCLHDGNDDRYENLLKHVGLENHLLDYGSKYIAPMALDKGNTKKRLDEYRKSSVDYLGKILL